MTHQLYAPFRIQFQDSEQAAKAAFDGYMAALSKLAECQRECDSLKSQLAVFEQNETKTGSHPLQAEIRPSENLEALALRLLYQRNAQRRENDRLRMVLNWNRVFA